MKKCLMRENDGNGGCGEWLWACGGGCGCEKECVGVRRYVSLMCVCGGVCGEVGVGVGP